MRNTTVRRAANAKPCQALRNACQLVILSLPPPCMAATGSPDSPGLPIEFVLFGLTLIGVALFHRYTLQVALAGLAVITGFKLAYTGFSGISGLAGLIVHMNHEWVLLANLLCLLVGFALLSRHFEVSRVPEVMPRFLPDDWKGGFVLLVLVWLMSGFLDNIAAAMIGATVAGIVFAHKVHIGYLAAIVAASNAGGAGSVLGDTTTTMMWLAGVSPLAVLPAYLAAGVALVVFGIPAALQQQRHAPIMKSEPRHAAVDWVRVFIVGIILIAAVGTSVTVSLKFRHLAGTFPFIGSSIWFAILICAPFRRPDWKLVPEALKGSIFLVALVTCASMMPVDRLPPASWQSSFALGIISSVFDNIPLTALALKQGGYDWAVLAYTVGFGGSMIWFGSSAGVAVVNIYPEAKSVWEWLKYGWHIPIGYVIGFLAMILVYGWVPA